MWLPRSEHNEMLRKQELQALRYDNANIALKEAFKTVSDLKTELEQKKTELSEAQEEIKRLNNLLAQNEMDVKAMFDEWANGPKDDRTEVIPWATSR